MGGKLALPQGRRLAINFRGDSGATSELVMELNAQLHQETQGVVNAALGVL